jgi:hypothetical protein
VRNFRLSCGETFRRSALSCLTAIGERGRVRVASTDQRRIGEGLMHTMTSAATGVLIILAVWAAMALLAVFGVVTAPVPPPWFDAWSRLIAAVAGTAIAARVLWSVQKQLGEFLDEIKRQRRAGHG